MTLPATQDVFELMLARPVVTAGGDHRSLVHLWWKAPLQGDRLVQVYVNGLLTEASQDPDQRDMWLILDRSRPQRIELIAVDVSDPDQVWRAHPERLASWSPKVSSVVSLTALRDERLPVDTELSVEVDGSAVDQGALWPADAHRGGFGSLFGLGDFGGDAITGPGLGQGELGMGPLGTDATAWAWRRDDLDIGSHELALSPQDAAGRPVANPPSLEAITIERLPPAATTLTIDPDFTLRWTT